MSDETTPGQVLITLGMAATMIGGVFIGMELTGYEESMEEYRKNPTKVGPGTGAHTDLTGGATFFVCFMMSAVATAIVTTVVWLPIMLINFAYNERKQHQGER